MTTTTSNETVDPAGPRGEIVARAGTYYRVTRYVITAVMVGMGLWFGYDGFVNWPDQNEKIAAIETQRAEARARGDSAADAKLLEEQNKIGTKHTDWDIMLQKILFFTLPPLGIALFVRWMYISRGAYRLTGDNVLHVPGHPPVPMDAVTELDKRLWDRKGIAYVGYELPGGPQGRLKLDDFVYEREPTDAIYKRIEDYVAPQAEDVDAPQEQSAG
jgi:hypothetical protein